MQNQNLKIIAIDDDECNLEILVKFLKNGGYETTAFSDSLKALEHMSANPDSFDLVLLDKLMPQLSGIEILAKMQEHAKLKNIPVIMQTADGGLKEIQEGLDKGAYYYLCKPFDPGILISMVNAASRDLIQRNNLYKQIKHESSLSEMLTEGNFKYKSIREATRLAAALASGAKHPDRIKTALLELMVNAVEHGNLNIGLEEKAQLLRHNTLDEEIKRREELHKNKSKYVQVKAQIKDEEIIITITDKGKGFNWQEYLDFDPYRLTEPNGRGIATAALMGTKISFNNAGNKVTCVFEKAC
jgi:DNA-binding response OmpR family regulator